MPTPEPGRRATVGLALAGLDLQSGTPARLRLVRMVCSVCTRVTVGEPVKRWVSWFSCAVSRATSFSRKSPPPRIM